jgi:hypothetical protein
MTVTTNDVFKFVGADSHIRSAHESMMRALIERVASDIESENGRKINKVDLKDEALIRCIDFEVYDSRLYLFGKYKDLFLIDEMTEDGDAVTDYQLKGGMIHRTDHSHWLPTLYGIKITGALGLVEYNKKTKGYETIKPIKQIIIETVAAKSGLWKQNVQTEGGEISTIRTTINEETKKALEKYKVSII